MANSNAQYQFLYSYNPMLTFIEGNFVAGASGAVTNVKGGGIKNIIKLSTGTYKVVLERPYYRYLSGGGGIVAPVSGTPVSDGSFIVGTTYVITTVGNTDWYAVGLDADSTLEAGIAFVATAVGGAGTGVAMAVLPSQIVSANVVGNPNKTISQQNNPYIILQCVDDSGVVANPEQTAVVGVSIMARYSSLKGKGE